MTARTVGCVLVFAAAVWWGISRTVPLRERPRVLLALADALSLLQSDTCTRLLPLPEALLHAAEMTSGPAKRFFSRLWERTMREDLTFAALWQEEAAALPAVRQEDLTPLLALGAQLGRYDAETQARALDQCIQTLRQNAQEAKQQAAVNARLYTGLGLTCGLLLAVTFY